MILLEYFSPQPAQHDLPRRLRDPFDNRPHSLAQMASEALQQRLVDCGFAAGLQQPGEGKMFGVLVVQDEVGRVGFLSAFSGMLERRWQQSGFAPPIFDEAEQRQFLQQGEVQLAQISQQIQALENDAGWQRLNSEIAALQQQKEDELTALRQQHRHNKTARRQQRSNLPDAATLNALSAQSQHDKRQYKKRRQHFEQVIDALQRRRQIDFEQPLKRLKEQRKRLSRRLHQRVFDGYHLNSFSGENRPLREFYPDHQPPGGSGDCAAPKLLQLAAAQGLQPLALAEFWYGAAAIGEVRQQGRFYPPCRGKCHPILPFMLQGVELEKSTPWLSTHDLLPQIIYQDEHVIVLNKPAGLLSTPGKQHSHSVLSWLQQRYPQAQGALLVHRLDMATSGLMLAAKSADAHKKLQQQFIRRSIQKRYVALLSGVLTQAQYEIDLPLRVDLDDRPRQRVCQQHGKPAQTRVEVLAVDASTTRVYFYPKTGRTHQLRVHAAHPRGLNSPIVGDELYGVAATRLCLHAESLGFAHPQSGESMYFQLDAEF